jgi:hypothetical protein
MRTSSTFQRVRETSFPMQTTTSLNYLGYTGSLIHIYNNLRLLVNRMGRSFTKQWDNGGCSLPDGQPPGNGRKVRSPQGSVPANGREGFWRRNPYGKCNRKYTARAGCASARPSGKGEMVRQERTADGAIRPAGQTPRGARPNRRGGAARSYELSGRSLEPGSNVRPR